MRSDVRKYQLIGHQNALESYDFARAVNNLAGSTSMKDENLKT